MIGFRCKRKGNCSRNQGISSKILVGIEKRFVVNIDSENNMASKGSGALLRPMKNNMTGHADKPCRDALKERKKCGLALDE